MSTTIIIDHPWKESYNHCILKELISNLEKNNQAYQIIDLCKDHFNPVMQTEELAVYQSGTSTDPLINKYIKILKGTTQLVLIFPIWWYSSPAGLKGFFDKILLNNIAFYDDGSGVKPLFDVSSTIAFTTSEQKTEDLIARSGNCLVNQFGTTLEDVGFKNLQWYNLGAISSLVNEERTLFLKDSYKKLAF